MPDIALFCMVGQCTRSELTSFLGLERQDGIKKQARLSEIWLCSVELPMHIYMLTVFILN